MPTRSRWLRMCALVTAAFLGGTITGRFAGAAPHDPSLYAPLEQLARVLAIVENQYVDPTDRAHLTEGALKGLVSELDPHSAYMAPDDFALFKQETEGKFGGVGVEVEVKGDVIVVVAPMEGSPAERAGVKPGDQVLAIDGRPVRGERFDKLITGMRGLPGSTVTLVVRRPEQAEPITFRLVREVIHIQSVDKRVLDKNVAYLRIKHFGQSTHQDFLRQVADLRQKSGAPAGVILDLRNNPGGLVDEAVEIADEFLDTGKIYSTRRRNTVVDDISARHGGALLGMPVVILVNEFTASSAELLTGALQDNQRATVVGAKTFGKGSVQTIFELPNGAGMRLTTMRYYTPAGRSIQAEGITPDVAATAGAPELVVRERDLDGHLASEGVSDSAKPRALAPSASAPLPASAAASGFADRSGKPDAVLAAAYRVLMGKMTNR